MSALSQLLPPRVLHQRFAEWNTLKKNIQDWAVREKFHFEISHKDKCYGDTSNILILNCIKIIDTYNTS